MNRNKRTIPGAMKLLAALFGILFTTTASSAATTPRILTVTLIQDGTAGVVIVDQQSGTIDSCTATFAIETGVVGKCLRLGHAAPSSAPPNPSAGLSVFTQLADENNSNTVKEDWVWVVNNQTGVITVCISAGQLGQCAGLGVAPE